MNNDVLTKHDVLTEDEMTEFVMNSRIMNLIEYYRKKMKIEKNELNILDWGCGRGRAVAWLISNGYNAFGTDIDPEPVKNCRQLLLSRGIKTDRTISLLDNGVEKSFADAFFQITCSDGVFEHIRDIEQVASNLKRLTAPGGVGIHFFPAHRHFVEIHLRMPFIHWLPKNKIRKLYISFLLTLGLGPKWKELQSKSKKEQVEGYYNYTANKTYYRTPAVLTRTFMNNNFEVNFIPFADFGLDKHPILKKISKYRFLQPFLNWAMKNFGQVGFVITRKKD